MVGVPTRSRVQILAAGICIAAGILKGLGLDGPTPAALVVAAFLIVGLEYVVNRVRGERAGRGRDRDVQ